MAVLRMLCGVFGGHSLRPFRPIARWAVEYRCLYCGHLFYRNDERERFEPLTKRHKKIHDILTESMYAHKRGEIAELLLQAGLRPPE